ncbi:putative high-affinity methionine permease [Triangularia setosa]|uniref:High-affinity methionine permease n=1 Tax=Triangularia setosa TaxID=2587417 RepID=A0AAN7A7J8_9PEZI|nr:putative high-affinity methionine permease [Podospora setosa]
MYQQTATTEPEPGSGFGFNQAQSPPETSDWAPGLDPQDQQALYEAREDNDAIVEEIPSEKDSLGRFSVLCLIFNRMIGSGIFNASSQIFYNTQSVGVTLLLWLCGVAVALSGVILYIELGLTVPRWERPDGIKISTPRSGGELPYLNYFLKLPRFLATCLFGVSFLVFGNTATNSIAFAAAVLQASGTAQTAGRMVVIALAVNTFSCLLHSMSRKWGIRLNNVLGSLKVTMLVIMVIFGLRWLNLDVARDNFDSSTSLKRADNTQWGVYKYAEALIYAIFPFGGFHQANYVLAEIKAPHKNFARTSGYGVLFISCLFMTITILYAATIPKADLFTADLDIAFNFFKRTVGSGVAESTVKAACGSLRALSAIGNVIVFTFTAARVKQEVAKEGVLPGSIYLASSYEFTFRHGFRRIPDHQAGGFLHTEKSPAAALGLHWTVTSILILAAMLSTDSVIFSHLPGYSLLLMAYAYGLDVIWFSCIGVGMLYLRLWPGSKWRYKSPIPHVVGVIAAVIFTATNIVPLVTIWVYDPAQRYIAHSSDRVGWFAPQMTAMVVLVAAGLYWVGFRIWLWQKRVREGVVWEVVRTPIFWAGAQGQGRVQQQGGTQAQQPQLVQIYEIIRFKWRVWTGDEEEGHGSEKQEGQQHGGFWEGEGPAGNDYGNGNGSGAYATGNSYGNGSGSGSGNLLHQHQHQGYHGHGQAY